MQVRRFWLVPIALLIPAAAQAHEHRMGAYGGITVRSGSVLTGGHAALAFPLWKDERGIRRWSIVFDSSTHDGSDDHRESNIMSGIRYDFAWKSDQETIPFLQLLVGGAKSKAGGSSDWDGGFAVGGGLEQSIGKSGLAVRGQIDVIISDSTSTRASFGIVARWPH